MPGTITGLLVVIVAVLPGSVYTWAYERQASPYGVTLADRTLRFIAVSVIFHLALAWPAYAVYRLLAAQWPGLHAGQFAVLWAGVVLMVAITAGAGTVLGGLYATRTNRSGWAWLRSHLDRRGEERLLRAALGHDPAPRAWDDLFSERPTVYLRIRTSEGEWVAGLFAGASYAGGFPHDSDLYLEQAWSMTEDGTLDKPLDYALYLPASKIELIEIVPQVGEEVADADQ